MGNPEDRFSRDGAHRKPKKGLSRAFIVTSFRHRVMGCDENGRWFAYSVDTKHSCL